MRIVFCSDTHTHTHTHTHAHTHTHTHTLFPNPAVREEHCAFASLFFIFFTPHTSPQFFVTAQYQYILLIYNFLIVILQKAHEYNIFDKKLNFYSFLLKKTINIDSTKTKNYKLYIRGKNSTSKRSLFVFLVASLKE